MRSHIFNFCTNTNNVFITFLKCNDFKNNENLEWNVKMLDFFKVQKSVKRQKIQENIDFFENDRSLNISWNIIMH